uniref:Uncharacterized protein n=1 Tax=Arundo donax TaxID=35708 RepID=A0A0A9A0Y3_ARUDO
MHELLGKVQFRYQCHNETWNYKRKRMIRSHLEIVE